MRVLLFTTAYRPLIGGSEIAIEELTRRIPDVFFDIVTARLDKSPAFEEAGNVRIYRTGSKWLFPLMGFLKSRSLIRVQAYAYIHAFQASYGAGAGWMMKLFSPKMKFIVTLQEGKDLGKQSFFVRFFRSMILRKADIITAISRYLLEYARAINPGAKLVLLPNGVNEEKFAPVSTNNQQTVSSLITVSRLVPKNGVDMIIRALPDLRGFRLTIAGTGIDERNLIRLAEDLGVRDRVIFAGNVSQNDLPGYLHQAKVFVRPSRSEGLGIAFLEAMAAGIPVIATPVGGIPDFLKDGETGLFCEVDNPMSIISAVMKLENDQGLRSRIIEQGRKLVHDRFNWDVLAMQYRAILSS